MDELKTSDPLETGFFLSQGYELLSCEIKTLPMMFFTFKVPDVEQNSQLFEEESQKGFPNEELKIGQNLTFLQEAIVEAILYFQGLQASKQKGNDD